MPILTISLGEHPHTSDNTHDTQKKKKKHPNFLSETWEWKGWVMAAQ